MAFAVRLESSLSLCSRRTNPTVLSHPSRPFSLIAPVPNFNRIGHSSHSLSAIKASSASASASASSSSFPAPSLTDSQGFTISSVPTKPYDGQKTGTSGLRKKVKVFMQENYLANWIQALFNSLPPEDYVKGLLVLGGDGRYFNKEAAQIIIKIAAANGVAKILVGQDGILSTPAVSAVIRKRKANGGFIMSASHNPGGPEYDWGIKFNYSSGQPAPESITDKIYGNTLSISEIKSANIPDVDLSRIGVTEYGNFVVEVVDPVADYMELMETVFDFQLIRSLLSRSDFRFTFDAMHAVAGAYAKPIFVDRLGASPESISNGVPLEDFGHGHQPPSPRNRRERSQTIRPGTNRRGAG